MADASFKFTRALVRDILEHPLAGNRKWTVQGFGMLRTYFGPESDPKIFRLNLWDGAFRVPDVSTIHDHPWDFESLIVAGRFVNRRFVIDQTAGPSGDLKYATHNYMKILCGEGGGPSGDTEECVLFPVSTELYEPGEVYSQTASEIHESVPVDGSVTVNERIPLEDGDHARVFWPRFTSWVSAEPRPAESFEVSNACGRSLNKWFR